jgi:trans-aconitate 2-methyltransferase
VNTHSPRDWSPEDYEKFRSLRLRPAFDLLGRVGDIPPGRIVDLGCGNGTVASSIKRRFPKHELIGVDTSPAMLRKAKYAGVYDRLDEADAGDWSPGGQVSVIFSNALCHWLPDHEALFKRLASYIAPGGMLAVQMPRQYEAASHAMLRVTAEALFPDRFDFSDWTAPVATPRSYLTMLDPLGSVEIWETEYLQRLKPAGPGHPVTQFTESTAMRPFLDKLDDSEQVQFMVTYDAAMKDAYPVEQDGSVILPFRRLFFTVMV